MATPEEFAALVARIRNAEPGTPFTSEQKAPNIQVALGCVLTGPQKIHLSHKVLDIVRSTTCAADFISIIYQIRGIMSLLLGLNQRTHAYHFSSGRAEAGLQRLHVDFGEDPEQTLQLRHNLNEWDRAAYVAAGKEGTVGYNMYKSYVETWYSLEKRLEARAVGDEEVGEENAGKDYGVVVTGGFGGKAFDTRVAGDDAVEESFFEEEASLEEGHQA